MEEKTLFGCCIDGWKTCFTYRGCVSRKYLWSFFIVHSLLLAGVALMLFFWIGSIDEGYGSLAVAMLFIVIFTVCCCIIFLPLISLTIRHMHDIGRSGWWVGGLFLLQQILPILAMPFIGYDYKNINAGLLLMNFLYLFPIFYLLWICCQPSKKNASKHSSLF